MPSRTVICADSLKWMPTQPQLGAVVSGLPDSDECGISIAEWEGWFVAAVKLCLAITRDDCPAIFLQTDRKDGGRVYSKSHLCFTAAEELGYHPMWHKIVLRKNPGGIDLYRPTFTHLLAFTKKAKFGKTLPDVIEGGPMLYKNAIGINATIFAVGVATRYTNLIVDPFCGRGTILAVANALGADAIGVDILPEQCKFAEKLTAGGVITLPACLRQKV